MPYEVALPDGFTISDEFARLDLDEIHRFIATESYWGKGRPRELFERSLRNCIGFGLYAPDGRQIGFARVLSDRALRAHIGDVYVLQSHRGAGLGKALIAAILGHPDLASVGVWTLNTDDAHGLYAGFGFTPLARPETFMIRDARDTNVKPVEPARFSG
jgi:GNAT superfamily N-acetyltransferase